MRRGSPSIKVWLPLNSYGYIANRISILAVSSSHCIRHIDCADFAERLIEAGQERPHVNYCVWIRRLALFTILADKLYPSPNCAKRIIRQFLPPVCISTRWHEGNRGSYTAIFIFLVELIDPVAD